MHHLASRWVRVIGVGLAGAIVACGGGMTEAAQPVALHVQLVGTDVPFALNVGAALPLEALPIAADSAVVGAAAVAAWSSSDTTVATVTSVGLVQARCVGETTIAATALVGGRSLTGSRLVLVGTTGTACAP